MIYKYAECSGLTSVIIPNSVTSIGRSAFSECRGLTSVTIPDSVTSIESNTFACCSALAYLSIGSGITSIASDAFWECNNIIKVSINSNDILSKNYKESGNISHFFGDHVKEYIIGSDVKRIGNNAFYGCSELTTAKILCQESAEIGENAFYNCSKLNVVELGKGVSSIGNGAFGECKNIQDVVSHIDMIFPVSGIGSTSPTFSATTFYNANLYVPEGTLWKYQKAEGWKDFWSIQEGVPDGINCNTISTENVEEKARYTLNGTRLTVPQRGINIIRMSDGTTKKVVIK